MREDEDANLVKGLEKSPTNWIYLDYHATTPPDPRVIECMDSVQRSLYGNPDSPHAAGRSAQQIVTDAREAVSRSIGALAGELVFTSGATESNNLAIQGLTAGLEALAKEPYKVITSSIEHKSVTKAASSASRRFDGVHVEAPVTTSGTLDLSKLEELVDERTYLVSVQAANNELGTIQPVKEAAAIAHSVGARFHCDAAQALGRLPIDVEDWDVDLMSLSGHKVYGPKGIGVLYVKGGPTSMPIEPLFAGGGQEHGLRSGTLNVPAIAGLGRACEIIRDEQAGEVTRLAWLRDRFEQIVLGQLPFVGVVGSPDHRLASTTNLRFRGLEADALLARLKHVALSSGSACDAGAPEPSHVLQAIGLDRTAAYECIRIAVGRFTTQEEVEEAARQLTEAALELMAVAS